MYIAAYWRSTGFMDLVILGQSNRIITKLFWNLNKNATSWKVIVFRMTRIIYKYLEFSKVDFATRRKRSRRRWKLKKDIEEQKQEMKEKKREEKRGESGNQRARRGEKHPWDEDNWFRDITHDSKTKQQREALGLGFGKQRHHVFWKGAFWTGTTRLKYMASNNRSGNGKLHSS